MQTESMKTLARLRRAIRSRWRWLAAAVAALIAFALWLRLGPIDPALLDLGDTTSTVVVDRTGVPLYEALSSDEIGNVGLGAKSLPPVLVAATLAAEDRRFRTASGCGSHRHRASTS